MDSDELILGGVTLDFSQFALGLKPYISCGMKNYDYFTELIGNFIRDSVMDSCVLMKYKKDTKSRYISGNLKISPENANFVFTYKDKDKFSAWIAQQTEEAESYDDVAKWLKNNGINDENVDDACANLLAEIFLNLTQDTVVNIHKSFYDNSVDLINEIEKKIKQLPRPQNLEVPEEVALSEQKYVTELYKAYGDAEQIDDFCEDSLSDYPDYQEDLHDRRVDYFAAESINRTLRELEGGNLRNQFDVLKNEIHNGVKDTLRRKHNNGYDHMLAVMEQSVNVSVDEYLLGKFPYWLNNNIKKGVCHHLVNDNKIHWVKNR